MENNLRYLQYAINTRIQGVVKVKFNVKKDGSTGDYEIRSSPNKSMSEEVLRWNKTALKHHCLRAANLPGNADVPERLITSLRTT